MKKLIILLVLAVVAGNTAAQTGVVHDYLWIQYNPINAQVVIISSDTSQSKLVQVERERRRGLTVRFTTRMVSALFTAVQEFEAMGWELIRTEPAMSVMVMRRPKR
jgi:hypothetical protein